MSHDITLTCTWRITLANRLLQPSSPLIDSFTTPSATMMKILGRFVFSGPRTMGLLLEEETNIKLNLHPRVPVGWQTRTFRWGHRDSWTCGRLPLYPRWVAARTANEGGSRWRWRTLGGTSWLWPQQRCSSPWRWRFL